MAQGSIITSSRHNGAPGAYYSWQANGNTSRDSGIYCAAGTTYSERITPLTSSYKMTSQKRKVPVLSGKPAGIICYVRPSIAADGTAYSGNPVRLMYAANYAAGLSSAGTVAVVTPLSGIISSLTYTSPIVITCNSHGLTSGDSITIAGMAGTLTPTINGNWKVSVISNNTFSLVGSTYTSGFYTSSSASASFGKWVMVSGYTPAVTDNTIVNFYVDCDGTNGWINVDFPSGELYWENGQPQVQGVPISNYSGSNN